MHTLVKQFHENGISDVESAKRMAGGKSAAAAMDVGSLNDKIKNIDPEDI